MKGLIIKDLMIIRNQWKSLLLIFVLGIMLTFGRNPSSAINYFTIISGTLALGTLSYDEVDNGYRYLFTLPASRKTYVREKYLFSICLVLVFLALGTAISILAQLFGPQPDQLQTSEMAASATVMLMVTVLLLAVEIPLRLKFGIEKSRIALFIFLGLIAALGFAVYKLIPEENLEYIMVMMLVDPLKLLVILAAYTVLILAVSYHISVAVLEAKEF